MLGERVTPIAPERLLQLLEVLQLQRLVKTELLPDSRDGFRRNAWRNVPIKRVAGVGAHEEKREH